MAANGCSTHAERKMTDGELRISREQLALLKHVGTALLKVPARGNYSKLHQLGRDVLRTVDEIRGAAVYEMLAQKHGWTQE
jgi:hypothetical protein